MHISFKSPKIGLTALLVVLAAAGAAQLPVIQSQTPGAAGRAFQVADCKLVSSYDLMQFSSGLFRYSRKNGSFTSADFNYRCAPGGDEDCDDLIDDMLHSVLRPTPFSLYFMDDASTHAATRYNFFECWPTRWKAPACDIAGGTRPGYEEITFRSMVAPTAQYSKFPPASSYTKQKKWLCSNFRLTLAGCPAASSRVTKIDAFTVKQGIQDADGDGVRDYDCDDFVIEVPVDAIQECLDWFAQGSSRTGSLEYLDASGATLHRLSFSSLTPSSITRRSASTYQVCYSVDGGMSWTRN